MTILITGSSGFIGSNLVQKLNKLNKVFYTIDKVKNPYLKTKNFFKINLCDEKKLEKVFKENKINYVIHLAAYQVLLVAIIHQEMHLTTM